MFLSRPVVASVLAALFLPSWTLLARNDIDERAESRVSIRFKDGVPETHRILRRFDVVRVPLSGTRQPLNLLLKEERDEIPSSHEEGTFERLDVKLEAFEIEPGRKRRRFLITARGTETVVHERPGTYVVTEFGHCDVPATHATYSLVSGKLLFYSSGGESPGPSIVVRPDDGAARFIGVHVSNSDAGNNGIIYPDLAARTVGVLISYASVEWPLQRLLLEIPAVDGWSDDVTVDKIEWRPETQIGTIEDRVLRVAQAGAASFRVVFGTRAPVIVWVDVKNDRFDLTRSKLPAGAKARLLPGPK